MWNGRLIMVKEGQLITGRTELIKATGIPGTTIERILQMLENEHQIGQQKQSKYRLITIVNWGEHQNRTLERTTDGQQTDTNKNDKNDKEENVLISDEIIITSSSEEGERERPLKTAKEPNLEKCAKYWNKLCKENVGMESSAGIGKSLGVLKLARKSLEFSQIKEMMDDWFNTQSLEDHEMIQITRCFSTVQIDKYLSENS